MRSGARFGGLDFQKLKFLYCREVEEAPTYERESLPQQMAALAKIRGWVQAGERVARTCFERLPEQCHRHCVAEAMARTFGRRFAPTHL